MNEIPEHIVQYIKYTDEQVKIMDELEIDYIFNSEKGLIEQIDSHKGNPGLIFVGRFNEDKFFIDKFAVN